MFQKNISFSSYNKFCIEILINVTTPSRMLINYFAMLPSNIIAGPKLA